MSVTVAVHNIGSMAQNNMSMTLNIPVGWNVTNMLPASGVVSNGIITWMGIDLALFETKNFTAFLDVPTSTPMGTSYSYIATAISQMAQTQDKQVFIVKLSVLMTRMIK